MPVNPAWEELFKTREWGRAPNPGAVSMLVNNFYWADRKKIKVLDLGCGFGANTWYAAAEGYDTYAIDGSLTARDKTIELLISLGLCAAVGKGDIAAMPYETGIFDAVIDSATISCSNAVDSAEIYKEVARVMKPGGLLYTQCFAMGTDPKCFPPGTYNRICSLETMNAIMGPQFEGKELELCERRTNVAENKGIAVAEWKIVAKKK